MKRTLTLAALAVAAVPLAACSGGYSYGARVGYAPYAYDGWYDGYYGPIYDGYWGSDGFFWYRHGAGDRAYIRGDRDHFRHDGGGDPNRFRPMHGQFNPDRGAHMPHFDRDHGRH